MLIDELKAAWKEYDRKIEMTTAINERMITNMIADRSKSRWTSVKRQFISGFVWMGVWIVLGLAILAGNPFDYKYLAQYIPAGVYVLCLLILVISMGRAFRSMQNVDFSAKNLEASLSQIISIYEKPGRFSKWTLRVLVFSSSVVFPISFLPKKLDHMGLLPALGDTLLASAISISLVVIAAKLGAFRQPNKDRFKEDLAQLEELRMMMRELKN